MSAESSWFVRLPNGNVVTVSLDQLDAGFQRGDIDENTLVFKHGMKEWLPLGQAAGIDDEVSGADDTVRAPSSSPTAFAPASPTVSPLAPYAAEPDAYSVRPVAFDMQPAYSSLDIGDDYAPPKSGKMKVLFGLVAAAAVVGLGIFGASQMTSGDAAAAAAAIATQAPANAAAAVAPPPAADPIPAVPVADNRLSDEQKKSLMKFDEKTKADQAKKDQARADRAAKAAQKWTGAKRGKGKEPFVKGGSKYDPLNASL
jgi:hypothetical protein